MVKMRKIFEDKRGEINLFEIGGREFLLFFTKKDALRGGHIHDLREYCAILEGSIERHLMIDDQDQIDVLNEGDFSIVPPKIPHLVKALTDCWMIEWHEYPKNRIIYEPYRKLVERYLDEKD